MWRRYWRWCSRRRGGRPPKPRELIALIKRMSLENPLWGAPRIHAELLLLGFKIAQSTVQKYMIPRQDQPLPGWKTFLRTHADAICAIDFLTVETLSFQRLYAFVVLGLHRRKILHIEVTDHPTAAWLAHQITEAFPWDEARPWLIRDNDRAYGAVFRKRLKAMGIKDKPITPKSPWQNGHVERLIGSIRRECLDHRIVLGQADLRRTLRAYADYYNHDRPHLALNKNSPEARAVDVHGLISARPVLGGLHHRYYRRSSK